jgi:hypothetical protein
VLYPQYSPYNKEFPDDAATRIAFCQKTFTISLFSIGFEAIFVASCIQKTASPMAVALQ